MRPATWRCRQTTCLRDDAVSVAAAGQQLRQVIVLRADGTPICASCGVPTVLPAGVNAALLPAADGSTVWAPIPGGP